MLESEIADLKRDVAAFAVEAQQASQANRSTGLIAVNGKEIMHGDIVRHNNRSDITKPEYWFPVFSVVWDAPSFELRHIGGGLAPDNPVFLLKHCSRELEIIDLLAGELPEPPPEPPPSEAASNIGVVIPPENPPEPEETSTEVNDFAVCWSNFGKDLPWGIIDHGTKFRHAFQDVEIKYRDGSIQTHHLADARNHPGWAHTGGDGDIIAYRFIPAQRAEPSPEMMMAPGERVAVTYPEGGPPQFYIAGGQASLDVIRERHRQLTEEGFTPERDDASAYDSGASPQPLTAGAVAYIIGDKWWWPTDFSPDMFKPTTTRRNLVKAAALLIAEIERLDRAEGGGK